MADFSNYYGALAVANTQNGVFPINVLNDINLLYSYTQEDFLIRGVPVIENMIYNVCYTPIGSREFEPEFGSRVLVMVEEQLTRGNMDIIEIELLECLKRWVPYIAVIFREIVCVGYPDQYMVTAYINYIDLFHGLAHQFVLDLVPSQIG